MHVEAKQAGPHSNEEWIRRESEKDNKLYVSVEGVNSQGFLLSDSWVQAAQGGLMPKFHLIPAHPSWAKLSGLQFPASVDPW